MFRLFGFDVRIRPGFVIFVVLIVALYPEDFGLWFAGAITVFTLIHELGHAVVARRNGAHAAISLEFLAGYTSYRPSRPLTLGQRAAISVAGPAAHILSGVAVLAVMGVSAIDRDGIGRSAATAAVFWAGPMIGALNLIPVLPLDGGHIVQTGLERVAGPRASQWMVYASIALTGGFAVYMIAVAQRPGFGLFVAFLLITQFSMLGDGGGSRRSDERMLAAAAAAERDAWQSGRSGMLVPGQELSPWYRAHRARLVGDVDEARQLLVDDFARTGPRRWWPPTAASDEQLRELVALLPRPLPTGDPAAEHVLADVLLRLGDRATAGHYAAESFARHRSIAPATVVARAAAAMRDPDTAIRWLHAAAAAPDATAARMVQVIDGAPELAGMRDDRHVRELRASLVAAGPAPVD